MNTINKLMIGVAAGAILGILYAPDKGSITRDKLSRRGRGLRDKLNQLKDVVNDKIINTLKEDDGIGYPEPGITENETVVASHSWQS